MAWAVRPDIPVGRTDDDLTSTVALGLLRIGLAAARSKPDDVLRAALGGVPRIIREQGEQLDATALSLSPHPLFDGAVRSYERLLERAVNGRTRERYAVAGSYAKVIRAIRTLQGRAGAFDAYPRLPAFKDELRSAIEGPG